MPQGSVGRWGCEKKCIVGSRPGGGGDGPGWIPQQRRRRRQPENNKPRSRSQGRLDGTGWETAGGVSVLADELASQRPLMCNPSPLLWRSFPGAPAPLFVNTRPLPPEVLSALPPGRGGEGGEASAFLA